ncbi:2-iminobutanoate/2-iminopropanoate deaminase-like [Microcaecilia unicolor]|uniref:2-iminobutanoate/2-iminopropanoate deaminase-like n=1 Tax=Microcaecilia unicolor TaxID=1415580 RepID=A0A6P7X514_9AMPH|nr:2-iminobutanoate/2-iminopropanoate deaminase-like [Microcaecilia unicolor]
MGRLVSFKGYCNPGDKVRFAWRNYSFTMAATIRKVIYTPRAPIRKGIYSQAVVVDKTMYICGVVGIDVATGQLVPGGVLEETKQSTKLSAVC